MSNIYGVVSSSAIGLQSLYHRRATTIRDSLSHTSFVRLNRFDRTHIFQTRYLCYLVRIFDTTLQTMDLGTQKWVKKPGDWSESWKNSFRLFNKQGLRASKERLRLTLYDQLLEQEQSIVAMIGNVSVDMPTKLKVAEGIRALQLRIEQLEQNMDPKTQLVRNLYGTKPNPFATDQRWSIPYVKNPYNRPIWFVWDEEHLRQPVKVFNDYVANIRNLGDFPHCPFKENGASPNIIAPQVPAVAAPQVLNTSNVLLENAPQASFTPTQRKALTVATGEYKASTVAAGTIGTAVNLSDVTVTSPKPYYPIDATPVKPSPVQSHQKPPIFTPLPIGATPKWDLSALEYLIKSTEKRQEERAAKITEREYAELRDADEARRQGIHSVASASRQDSHQSMKESYNLLERIFHDESINDNPVAPIAALWDGCVPATPLRNKLSDPPIASIPIASITAGVNNQDEESDDYDDL